MNRRSRGRPRLPWWLLVVAAALLVVLVWRGRGEQPLELVFLDVGQGDATLIRTPDGRTALVDGGRSGSRLVGLLEQLDVRTLDLVIASHADADHIGGLDHAVDDLPPRFFLDNGLPHTTRAYADLLDAVERSDATYLEATERRLTLGDAVLTVLPPPRSSDEQNDNSVGLLLEYGAFRALLPGDAPAEEQAWWLERYRATLADIDVYKAAHHGSATGDREWWLQALGPAVVVISAGEGNPYGHPHREPLAAYDGVGARIYRTDRDGSVTVLVPPGGAGYRVRSGGLAPAAPEGPLELLEGLLVALLDAL